LKVICRAYSKRGKKPPPLKKGGEVVKNGLTKTDVIEHK